MTRTGSPMLVGCAVSPGQPPSLARRGEAVSSPHDGSATGACHWWAYATLTRSPGARAHYDRRKADGDTHNAALRNLANKLLSKLWHCFQTNTPYHETSAWPTLETAAA
jgi:hypothetical protein